MDLYKVQNLPALCPDLGVQFSNILEGQYPVNSKHSLYAAILMRHDIRSFCSLHTEATLSGLRGNVKLNQYT